MTLSNLKLEYNKQLVRKWDRNRKLFWRQVDDIVHYFKIQKKTIILAVDRRSRISGSFFTSVDRINIYGPVIISDVFLIILF